MHVRGTSAFASPLAAAAAATEESAVGAGAGVIGAGAGAGAGSATAVPGASADALGNARAAALASAVPSAASVLSRAFLIHYLAELGSHSPAAGLAFIDALMGVSGGTGGERALMRGEAAPHVVGDYAVGDGDLSGLLERIYGAELVAAPVAGSPDAGPSAAAAAAAPALIDGLLVAPQPVAGECTVCQEPLAVAPRPSESADGSGGDDDEDCGVVLALPCAHCFHDTCLRPWLMLGPAGSPTCPSCRAAIITESPVGARVDSEVGAR